jgi:hypothetical protein
VTDGGDDGEGPDRTAGATEPSDAFTRLVEAIGTREGWTPRRAGDGAPPTEAASVRFDHLPTGAVLEVERLSGPVVAALSLYCTLDPALDRDGGGFAASIAEAHHAIAVDHARRSDRASISPETHPSLIATATVPGGDPVGDREADAADRGAGSLDGTRTASGVATTVSVLEGMAVEVARLHEALCAPLATYVERPCSDARVPARSPTDRDGEREAGRDGSDGGDG